MDDSSPAITNLAVLTQRTLDLARSDQAIPPGRIEQLEALARRIRKIRGLGDSRGMKRVGVFGAPKRGKSSLLNALLGEDLLPTSPVPLSTTTIEIERDPNIRHWRLVINHSSGRIENRDCDTAKEVAGLLEKYGSRRGGTESAERLRLKGAFPDCRILEHGGMLMDTPGAEVAFETDAPLEREAERAINALDDTHLVLFCIRADQIGARTDSEFYEKHVRRHGPVHVATMKDKWHEDLGALADEVFRQYGLARANPVLFSATEARAPGTRSKSGIDELETKILDELDRLSPENGLVSCLGEYALAVEDHPQIVPKRIHFLNLLHSIHSLGANLRSEAQREMSSNPDLWNLSQ